MNRDDYCRIRDEVYKNAGMDKFDFDLMMFRVVDKAVQEEREACAKVAEERFLDKANCTAEQMYELQKKSIAAAIRARGKL